MSESKTNAPKTRRAPEQWQQLVEAWQHSNQSAKQFCTSRDIGYASFCQWRRRLTAQDAKPIPEPGTNPEFIDLSALSPGAGAWRIVLSLGNGVELRLSQS